MHSLTDSVKEVAAWAAGLTVVGALLYWNFEQVNPFEAMYWSIVSGSSTGYGDITPKTAGGRITTMVYIIVMIWVVSPILQGRITAYMTVDNNAWTNDEQEEVKDGIRALRAEIQTLREQLKDLT